MHCHVGIFLLNDKYGSCEVARILLLVRLQVFNIYIGQENIDQIINLFLVNIWQLVHVSTEADVPTLFSPIAIGSEFLF